MIEFDEFWEGYVKEGTHVNEWKAAKASWQACKEALEQQWVGLSDDDIHNLADHSFTFASGQFDEIFKFANAINAKLKELNT